MQRELAHSVAGGHHANWLFPIFSKFSRVILGRGDGCGEGGGAVQKKEKNRRKEMKRNGEEKMERKKE